MKKNRKSRRAGGSTKQQAVNRIRTSVDAIFTSQPIIREGRIENAGDIWVIMNSSEEELDDFFREGLGFDCDDFTDIVIRDDPKAMMCVRIKGDSTIIMGEAFPNADFLLSKIISTHFREI